MSTPSCRTVYPADRLADVRVGAGDCKGKEEELRAYLLEHPDDRTGDEYIAVVGLQSQKRVDLKALTDEIAPPPVGPTIKPCARCE